MIQQLIDRYKRIRTERFLAQTFQCSYAFVGMGQHSLTNLYPVLHYLGVPLKYVCVTSGRKARLTARKFPNMKTTTSLDDVLSDETVKGVFVSASPSVHFSLASRILQSGKSLFIEKPPCQSLQELDALIDQQRLYGSPVAMVGLQKRYAPAVQILQKRLRREHLFSYDFHYLTGAYPEGDALLDLYIHPLDLVTFLFGKPEILACQQVAPGSYILMLRHSHIIGTLELSTHYTWTTAEESFKVCTSKGIYRLSQMELLTFQPKPASLLGIPTEKIVPHGKATELLCERSSFTPTLASNQVYTQGYYNELTVFLEATEGRKDETQTGLQAIRPTFQLINDIQTL